MNYKIGFFILTFALGGVLAYVIFKPKQVDNSAIKIQYERSKEVQDSLVNLINNQATTINTLNNELKSLDTIYIDITKPELIRRSDSLYNRFSNGRFR